MGDLSIATLNPRLVDGEKKERVSWRGCSKVRKEEVGGSKEEKNLNRKDLSRKEKVVDRPQEIRTPDEGSNCNIEKA